MKSINRRTKNNKKYNKSPPLHHILSPYETRIIKNDHSEDTLNHSPASSNINLKYTNK